MLYAKVVMENLFHQRGWHSKNAVDMYLEGSWFKSWLVILTAFCRCSFSSHSEQFLELYIDWFMTHSYTVLYMTALLNKKQKKNTASWREWNKNMNYIKLEMIETG